MTGDNNMKYIADTNYILDKPEALEKFEMVITSHVSREIEHLELKNRSDRQLQFEIRRLKRMLDEHKHLTLDLKDYQFKLSEDLDSQYVDNILLQVAIDNGYGMATGDRLLREKCRLYGIELLDYDKEDTFKEHKGFRVEYMSEQFYLDIMSNPTVNYFGLITNEYLIMNNIVDGELLDLTKWTGKELVSLRNSKGKLDNSFRTNQFGEFKPLDEYQIMAVDSIFNNMLTSIRGKAGSGKSLIALNTAWRLVEEQGYKLVIFTNPAPSANSEELGYYKGDRLAKIMQTTAGTMLKAKFGDEEEILYKIQDGMLDILPFSDLRGYDSGDREIIWILEAQNLTSELLKLGLQRIAEGSKVVVDGDYHQQIDKDVYIRENGMKRMSEVFRGIDLYGEVELQNVHRSRLALIAELM